VCKRDGVGGEGGAEEGAEFVAEATEAYGGRLPAIDPQGLGLGGDAGDRGVAERGDQAGIGTTQPARVHLGSQVHLGAVDERLELCGQRRRNGAGEPVDLAYETEQCGSANGRAEHRSHHGVDPVEGVVGRRTHGRIDDEH
jgi:hypothetical protein